MCGVFGYVAHEDAPISLKHLKALARATESRGQHAWGLAWIDAAGRLKMFKQSGRITDALGILAMAKDARILIGHCRYATHGDPANNLNNHPHSCDGGWLVHNGVIGNYDEVLDRYGLLPVTECDSEALALLIERLDGSLYKRCSRAAALATRSPLVMMGLWKPGRLIAIKQGNPLHLGTTKDGFYLASLADDLPGHVEAVQDGTALDFTPEVTHGAK